MQRVGVEGSGGDSDGSVDKVGCGKDGSKSEGGDKGSERRSGDGGDKGGGGS